MQNLFLIFFNPTIPPPTQPPTRHTIGRYSANMEATGTPRTPGHPGLPILYRVRLLILDHSSWTADPGPLIQALIFSLYRVRRYSATQDTAHPSRWRCGSSWTACGAAVDPGPLILSGGSLIQVDPSSDGPSIPGHPGPGQGHLIPLILDGG